MMNRLSIIVLVIIASVALGFLLSYSTVWLIQALTDTALWLYDEMCEYGSRPRRCGSASAFLLLFTPFIAAFQAVLVAYPIGRLIHGGHPQKKQTLDFYRKAGMWIMTPLLVIGAGLFSLGTDDGIYFREAAFVAITGLVAGVSFAWVVWLDHNKPKKFPTLFKIPWL